MKSIATKPISVLVVDDDEANRAMLSLSLRQAGYSVQSASNGPQALRLLKGESYDWLITDGRMSPINGFELSREAKRLQPSLRVVMVSAIFNEADIHNSPIEKFFSKPIPLDNLLALLEKTDD